MQDQVLWGEIDRLNDSMDVTSESDTELALSLEKKLSEWAMKFNISLTSLTHLLKILREHDIDDPAHGRTLLKTPRSGSLTITEKSGGKYTYFGIKEETSSCEDDMNLKQSGNEVKQSGLKTRNVPLPKPPIYHDSLQRSAKKDEDDPKSSAFSDPYNPLEACCGSPDPIKSPLIQKVPCVKTSGDCLDDNTESPDKSYFNSSQPNPVFLDILQGNVAMHEDDHPRSSASSGKEPKETKCKVTMEKLFDLNTEILQQIQMLEQRQAVIMNDLAKVKSVLMKWADEELFKQQQCSSVETFEAFCQRYTISSILTAAPI
ncbi:hypothetical protein G5714_000688 [Onychostoma macrolepis]|uniref:Uncharacterized protein n=1 Tax=Onychostoma macrolepis TaxID=369639 RepID=A0A7J6DH75_9TELE|nr:hypothetical protein G5714_000688 [Onychostoma macrolepis]